MQSVSTGRKTRSIISQCQFAMSLFSLHDIRKKAALKYFAKLKEKKPVSVSLFKQSSEAYSELCQTSNMERFEKIVDG